MINYKTVIMRCRDLEMNEQDAFKSFCYFINTWSFAQALKEHLTGEYEPKKWDEVNDRIKNYYRAVAIDKQSLITQQRMGLIKIKEVLNQDVHDMITFVERAIPQDSTFDSEYNMDMKLKRGCFAIVLPEYDMF